jgi:hypothetical protein
MTSMMKKAWVGVVVTGMFVVRMLTLALMALLQRLVGGADVRTPDSGDASPAA